MPCVSFQNRAESVLFIETKRLAMNATTKHTYLNIYFDHQIKHVTNLCLKI